MGFLFSDKIVEKAKKKIIPVKTAQRYGCKVCSLNRVLCRSPKMEASGASEPLLYILGEAPDASDDETGIPFVSNSFNLLKNHLPDDEHIRYNHAVNCKSPSEKPASLLELEACRQRVDEDIEKAKPLVILGIGKAALYWALKDQTLLNKEAPLTTWHNLRIPIKVGDHKCWFIPLHTPKEILAKRRKNKKTGELLKGEWDEMYKNDISSALDFLEEGLEPTVITEGYLDGVEWTEGGLSNVELNKVLGWIKKLKSFKTLALDIETDHENRTGDINLDIRPYSGDGLILTIALGDFDKTYSFPIDYPEAWTSSQRKKIKAALLDLLLTFKAGKIGHNIGFDLEWLAFYLGKELLFVKNWKDTQAQACAILNRQGILNLDVQILLNYGFNLKDLSSFDKGKMKEYPLKEILPYNGMDTKWTAKLYQDNLPKLEKAPALRKVADHMNRTVTTLLRGQNRGLLVDKKQRNSFNVKFINQIEKLEQEIKEIPEVKRFRESYRKEFNSSSPHDLLKMLKNIYGLDEELRNKKGKISTDETILSTLDLELTDKILELRGVAKKHSTYVKPLYKYIQETGLLHHQYNQYVTSTGRLSSSGAMNIQNFPNRKGKELRGQIAVEEGFALVPADYGQIEARIIAVAAQDEYYLKALWDDYDVHLEWAEKIAYAYPSIVGGARYLKDKKALKKFRGNVKNQWTFPAFYGASPYSIAKALGVPIKIVLQLFDEFWTSFSGVKEWQGWIQDFYKKHGYVESLTGRRRYGPMTFNELVNHPIQSTASDLTVSAMSRLEDAGIVTLMNIHDDVTSKVPIEELEETIPKIAEIMCSVEYPWINCPIAIEVSCGLNWYETEEIGTFLSTDFITVDPTIQPVGHYQEFLYAR